MLRVTVVIEYVHHAMCLALMTWVVLFTDMKSKPRTIGFPSILFGLFDCNFSKPKFLIRRMQARAVQFSVFSFLKILQCLLLSFKRSFFFKDLGYECIILNMIVGFLEINLASKYVYVHICNRFWASPRVPPEYNYNKKIRYPHVCFTSYLIYLGSKTLICRIAYGFADLLVTSSAIRLKISLLNNFYKLSNV